MKLFVGNLAWSLSDADLFDAFAEFGEVTEAKIITDRETGRSRGFAFVTMADKAAGEAAIAALNGKPLNDREIVVSEAKPRPRNERPQRGGW